MSQKQETDSIRISQVMAGALAAVTAAVLGSTMGFAGTVIGAGLASVVSTVGGALYLRSIQRTRQSVESVRNLVVARAGATRVTLVDEEPAAPPASSVPDPSSVPDVPDAPDVPDGSEPSDTAPAGEEQPPPARRLRWPALIAASVLAFVLGMLVITGVEWVRGAPLSGGAGTTVGGIVRTHPGGGGGNTPAPPSQESTTPSTGPSTVTVTPTPAPTSDDQQKPGPPTGSSAPSTTESTTTTGGTPSGSVPAPPSGGAG